MADKKYWKGIEERDQTASFLQQENKEFTESLPVLQSITEPLATESKSSRRDFLKMLGFSVTAATIAASCEMPVRKSIPYVFRPEEIVPGVANYYATTFQTDGDYCSVLVKTREGRPIKIEGNKLSIVSKGGTNARVQASVLSLYSGLRHKGPSEAGKPSTWEQADAAVLNKLNAISAAGGKIALITGSITGPSTKAAIAAFKTKFSTVDHIQLDAVSYSGLLDANQASFGLRAAPDYRFDQAKLIVGIGCDYLGTWLNPVEYAADWSKGRKVSASNKVMSRTWQIESVPTITGFKADMRLSVKPTDEIASLIALYNKITGSSATGALANDKVNSLAAELLAAKGQSIVVCGSNDKNVQMMVNAINDALGNYGSTIRWDRALQIKQGADSQTAQLLSTEYKAYLVYNVNPVLSHPNGAALLEKMKGAFTVALSTKRDETTDACNWVCPSDHYLESWGDAEPKAGIYNTQQPVISRLFDTRGFEESLLNWAGNQTNFLAFMQNVWQAIYAKQNIYNGFNAMWDSTIHDGELVTNSTSSAYAFTFDTNAPSLVASLAKGGELQLKMYESVGIGDGSAADNPWLQELPDPISKITWDNYVIANLDWVRKQGLLVDPDFKDKEYPIIQVTAGDKTIELPVVGVPGVAPGTLGIAVGYGKTAVSHDDLKAGKNAYPLLAYQGGNWLNVLPEVSYKNTGNTMQLAITQTHHNITHMTLGGMKTRKIVKETSLEAYKKNDAAGNEDRAHIKEELVTLYYDMPKTGPHWTMAIDLNSCTGCGACVVACNAENNVPVVGKDQVIRSREMHWMRIDRYFTGTEENPDVVYQPMLCQHCDNAPCENVCPVAATNHSSEGLNQMTYNRCIGTRYCANNCPYKVRRFNWYDYNNADSFTEKYGTENYLNRPDIGAGLGTTDTYTRMVLNPDVTVRSRGVIEKCSFCVQRLQEAKLTAKKDSRPLKDGEATTACQTACASGAIVFGDRNNKGSAVFADYTDSRTFGVIEEIHTLPNVLYKTQVRNRTEAEDQERVNTVFPQQSKVETAHSENHH